MTKNFKHMKHEDIPEGWEDRCSGDGYETIITEDGNRLYADIGISVEDGYRPCAKCQEYPTMDGDDHCLGNLGNVMNACCGHGNDEGYVQFDSGVTIRGKFEIERFEPYEMDYAIRTREEIFSRIEEMELEPSLYHKEISTLKWAMQMK